MPVIRILSSLAGTRMSLGGTHLNLAGSRQSRIKQALWYLWQLPQNLLGLVFWRAMRRRHGDEVRVLPYVPNDEAIRSVAIKPAATESAATKPGVLEPRVHTKQLAMESDAPRATLTKSTALATTVPTTTVSTTTVPTTTVSATTVTAPPRPLPADYTMINLPLPLFGGVSLGRYLFFGDPNPSANLVAHERGHMVQSRRLGPLYLLVVGVPSVARAMYHRRRHAHWTPEARSEWYHRHWPESAADRHGGVRR